MRRPLAGLTLATAAGLLLTGRLLAQNNYQFSDPNVEDLFRYARMAVGGGAVSKLKALQVKGRSKVDMGGSLLDCAGEPRDRQGRLQALGSAGLFPPSLVRDTPELRRGSPKRLRRGGGRPAML